MRRQAIEVLVSSRHSAHRRRRANHVAAQPQPRDLDHADPRERPMAGAPRSAWQLVTVNLLRWLSPAGQKRTMILDLRAVTMTSGGLDSRRVSIVLHCPRHRWPSRESSHDRLPVGIRRRPRSLSLLRLPVGIARDTPRIAPLAECWRRGVICSSGDARPEAVVRARRPPIPRHQPSMLADRDDRSMIRLIGE